MVAKEMRSARSYLVARELKRCKRIHGVVRGWYGVCAGVYGDLRVQGVQTVVRRG